MIQPPYTPLSDLTVALQQNSFALLSSQDVQLWIDATLGTLTTLGQSWNNLPSDLYLKDGGRYRTRRHSCFVYEAEELTQTPHRAHWQPVTYNALHGGIERWFEPIEPQIANSNAFQSILLAFARLARDFANLANPAQSDLPLCIEAHQFRIGTEDGIGRPTPEGAHRDGVDLVAVFMVQRSQIKGGETRVFDAFGTHGERFTLGEPWSLLLLDDAKMIHESTPIQPLQAGGYRDTLVLTSRAGSFQAQ